MLKTYKNSAYLITKPEHVFYLTNFHGEGFAVATGNSIILATDQRYWLMAKQAKKKGVKLFDLKSGWQEKLNEELKAARTIYFEDDHLTVSALAGWKKTLPKKSWKKTDQALKQFRLIKSEVELEALRKAAAIGDKILKKAKARLKPGVTEREIAGFIRSQAFAMADGYSFNPIVAFGVNAASPHHDVTDKKLKMNDAVLIDMGVKYRRYMSDMTRCFFIGKGISEVKLMYEKLLEAQMAAVNMVRPGVRIKNLCLAVRSMLGKDARYFTHSLGHGIGLKVHEGPTVSARKDDILKKGMVITIEPGLYKPGIGGVRIEDTVIVTENGSEVITKSPK